MKHILMVDDNLDNLYLARTLLEASGYRVTTASQGEEALALARAERPDLLVTDILMPVMDGFTLCRHWKCDPLLQPVPLVFYTATYVDAQDEQFARRLGADGFLIKPMEPDELVVNLAAYLERTPKVATPQVSLQDESVLLREYNATLIRKLEEKVQHLEELSQTLQQERERLNLALEAGGEGLWDWDLATGRLVWNERHYEMFQVAPERFDGTYESFMQLVHPDDRAETAQRLERARRDLTDYVQEFRVLVPGGEERWVSARGRYFCDAQGRPVRMCGIVTDVTEQRRNASRIQHLAYFDSLTELPNRVLLQDRTLKALATAQRDRHELAFLYIDLDNFKAINESLGHSMGDRLVQVIAKRLQGLVRATDTLARLSGDEFVLLMTEAGIEDAVRAIDQLQAAVAKPIQLDGHTFTISATIGVSIYPRDAHDYESLLGHADAAMHRSKLERRGGFQFFQPDMNASVLEQLQLESALRLALERNEFELHYQPQIDLATRQLVGFEALIRWRSPDGSLVPPMKFIPIAERSGLIIPIGNWVLREACRQNKAWQDAGLPKVPVAVNLSAIQFRHDSVADEVRTALEGAGLVADYLELEVTESLLLVNEGNAEQQFRALKDMGIRFAIDDFGTGYSNLAYLRRFTIHKLKIDRSFVNDLLAANDSQAIVSAVVNMGHSLRLEVIAEGVEETEQADLLTRIGCDQAQGYLYAKPLAAADMTRWLQEQAD